MRSFWNDSDGLSITDTIALLVVVPYILINVLAIIFPQYMESANIMIEHLKNPFIIVLSSYFGGTMISSGIATYYAKKEEIKK